MPYLNLDLNYFDHPKTRRLTGILGPMSDVLPLRLWAYCGKVHPIDGTLKGYTGLEIEGVIGWSGDPGNAVEALLMVRYLKRVKNGFACVDWQQHEGHLSALAERSQTANKARWERYRRSKLDSNKEPQGVPQGVQEQQIGSPPSVPSVPSPPIHPYRAVTGGSEKFKKCSWEENGVRNCPHPAEFHAMYCQAHLDKSKERNAHKNDKRDGGMHHA